MKIQGPILVALDGSEIAEGVLGPAEILSSALRTHLALVSVLEDPSDLEPGVAVEMERLGQEHFASYLAGVRERLHRPDIKTTVRVGNPAEEILACAFQINAGMIAIATHGRSGISRWMYGSTASALLQRSTVPILVVGPSCRPTNELRNVMVPLDGSQLAEEALGAALQIRDAHHSKLSLVRIVPWAVEEFPYTLPSAYVIDLDKELELGATAYMNLQKELVGGEVRTHLIRGGGTANQLMEFVERGEVDLVVMSTHGRAGVTRAALGSTADRMLQATAPILLVPAPSAQSSAREVKSLETVV